jgi:hypothetical protein
MSNPEENLQHAPPSSPVGEGAEWSPRALDAALAAAGVALILAASLPGATMLRRQAADLDRQRAEAHQRASAVRGTLRHLEERRADLLSFRRSVDRYVSQVEARPMVPWTTTISELSRSQPEGVWTTRLRGDGPRFRATVAAERPELISQYVRQVSDSNYVDLVSQPAGGEGGPEAELVGRMRGE